MVFQILNPAETQKQQMERLEWMICEYVFFREEQNHYVCAELHAATAMGVCSNDANIHTAV